MTRALVLFTITLLIGGVSCGSASAQQTCDIPTTNEWLSVRSPWIGGTFTEIDSALVHPVTNDMALAIAMLDRTDVVELNAEAVIKFVGAAAGQSRPDARPYLVRAVYPTSRPSLALGWSGSELHVFARGLGCMPFIKHPVIVFLDRRPERVRVMAAAAL